MARWAREGAHVTLLTVLALDPESTAPTRGWDERAGYATEGEAARARRDEDAAAAALLGVSPRWLPFGSVDFDRHGDDEAVWYALRPFVEEADVVLVPGSPLAHPDHAWLHELLHSRVRREKLAYYAEQPYTSRLRSATLLPVAAVGQRDRVAKWRAVRRYRSQLPLLGITGSLRRGPLRLAWTDERIAWLDGGAP